MHKRYLFLGLLWLPMFGMGQKVAGRLRLVEGTTIPVRIELKNTVTQQAADQVIQFSVSGVADHSYQVIKNTPDNATLRHSIQHISFNFEGMGQRKSYDSDNPNDINEQFGPSMSDILNRTYEMVIDTNGKTLLANPGSIQLQKPTEKFATIATLIRDMTAIVYPPRKEANSFFRVLPSHEVGVGDTWVMTTDTENEQSSTTYTLAAITDSTIIVNYRTTASFTSNDEIMNMPATTKLNSTAIGNITLDKTTKLIREKTASIESRGNTQAMSTTMPINTHTIITITVGR